MALGGFKFAGYKVTKPEGATSETWALLVHKARLKAFWDANVASGAGWEFDRTEGDSPWNWGSSSGDVIYYVDGADAQNLVSFFKKTGSVTKYYLIATMFNWQASNGNVSGLVKISKDAVFKARYNSDNQYKVDGKTLFHTVGYTRFPENCLDAAAYTYPQDALPLIPISGWTVPGSTANTNGASNMYKNANSLYVGCAVKGTNIISFISRTDTLTAYNNYLYTRVSLVGFDGMKSSSPNDSANIYGFCLGAACTELDAVSWSSGIPNDCQETLKDDFTKYPGNAHSGCLALTTTRTATFNGSPQNYPFESVSLVTGGTRNDGPFLNVDGITSKGTFDIDLIACNGSYTYSPFTTWASVANGNYLTAIIQRQGTSSLSFPQTTYYVGWDTSNPDITDPNSWPEYAEYDDNAGGNEIVAYLTNMGAEDGGDTTIDFGSLTQLYDKNGDPIPYESTKTYTLTGVYQALVEYEQLVDYDSAESSLENDDGYLALLLIRDPEDESETTDVNHVKYTAI